MATSGQTPPSVGAQAQAIASTRGSSFTPASLVRAERQAARVSDRWAPESGAALRSPALRSLAFVDRLLAPTRTLFDFGIGAGPGAPATPGAQRFAAASGLAPF